MLNRIAKIPIKLKTTKIIAQNPYICVNISTTAMKFRLLFTIIMLATCTYVSAAQPNGSPINKKTFFVAKPGTLVSLLTEAEADSVTHLTLTGKLNAIDFKHLRDEFSNLQVLDISNASISLYAGKNGTYLDHFYVYPMNCIPAFAFCKQSNDSVFQGKQTLRKVILSEKIKNIEDGAFKGCSNMHVLQINKKSAPNLLRQALADSITAIFIPVGCSDAFRNKKNWENFAIIEGDPVETTVQVGLKSSLASELIKVGLQPKDVNFLTVEGKLDEADFKLIRDFMPNLVSANLTNCNATAIPEYTFTQKKYLLSIQLPHNLKSIGQRAFSGCGRLCGTLVLPPSISAIEYGAFIGCDNLRHVMATGSRITTIGENLFGDQKSKLIYYK